MAFFKFRWPGTAAASTSDGLAAIQSDSAEVLRRKARQRLWGAAVLVCAAVVCFAVLFSGPPRPLPADVPLVLQDRPALQSLPPAQPLQPLHPQAAEPAFVSASVAVAPASAALLPEQPAPSLPPASPAPPAQSVAVAPPRAAPAPAAPVAPPAAQPKASLGAPASNAPPTVANKPAPDADKARALLEGKAAPAATGRWVVQAGAYTDEAKVKEVRRKLERVGLKTYIQTIGDKEGKRTVRVRLGPFESRADADKAAARTLKLDLPANVLAL